MAEEQDNGAPRSQRRPVIKLPSGFADEAAFLQHMRKSFTEDADADRFNRDAAMEDARFMVGAQWDEVVRTAREAARKPVLTFNRLPAFVAQIVGNRRLNETSIKVIADNGGTKETAQVREDLIRSIQKISKAEKAYDRALENQVIGGIGNFQLLLDYTDNDVFLQELRVASIPDPLSVVWDRMLVDPTGRDARHCFVQERLTQDMFQQRWPWAMVADADLDEIYRGDLRTNGWYTQDDVRVVAWWRMITRRRELALLNDGAGGTVADVTDLDPDSYLDRLMSRPDGTPYLRAVDKPFAQMYLCSGLDVLEGPYTLPIDRVPVFRVPGWEVRVGEEVHRWGLLRFLKDPQKLHNYWRSVVAEKLMMTPRAKWLAPDTAVAGREKEWRNAHMSDDPLLVWNADAGTPPAPVPPAQLEQALIAEAQMTTQDLRDISNLHEASLGMQSNEVSGKAILARQRIGDLGTVIYHDNLNDAISECGRVMNDLLPIVYDTPRTVKILGPDGKDKMQAINGLTADAPDMTTGKYAVTVTTGPSYQTRRIETAESMMNLINAMPQAVSVAADLIVEAQDWNGADQIAKRLRKMLPPGILDPEDMTPQERQAAAAGAQQHQAQEQVAMQAGALKMQNLQSQTAVNFAKAQRETALAQKAGFDATTQQANVSSEIAARAHKAAMDTINTAEGK